MKKIIMFFLGVILISCYSFSQQNKENNQDSSRTYLLSYDSVIKKLIEFTSLSNNQIKLITVVPGMVLLEETFDEEQAIKYTNIDLKRNNTSFRECSEKLFIYIKSDSSKTFVEIKPLINCCVTIKRFFGKASQDVNNSLSTKSSGAREKEILDFIGGNNLLTGK